MRAFVGHARQLAGAVYRRCAGPLGMRTLARMLDDGLPPRLAKPIEYLFTGGLPPEAREVSPPIEQRREQIAASPDVYRYVYRPGPPAVARWPERVSEPPGEDSLSSRWLAQAVSVPSRWGLFLHLCAREWPARGILELGAGVGVSGAYLASTRATERFVTVEGSGTLAAIATSTLAPWAGKAVVLQGRFETGIPRALALLARANVPLDLVYLDGHHDEAPTLHYVQTLIPSLSPGSLIVLDDIHLYAGMWRAWHQVGSMSGVAATVNVGRLGLVVRGEPGQHASSFDLARFTGWWRVGPSRQTTRPPAVPDRPPHRAGSAAPHDVSTDGEQPEIASRSTPG